jgi:RHS repeat-associated protein
MVMTLQKTREKFTGFDGVETCESETPQGYSVSWSKTNQRTIDANGSISSDNMYSYVYDAENRLVQVNFLNPQPTTKPDTVQMVYDGLGHRVSITELHGTTVLTAKTFVWDGMQPVQERDVTGHTVSKQFFSQGEQISGTNYYYVTDHLGNIREMTDSNGVVHANYDYDAFGRQTKLSGDLDSDFGYTGFYIERTVCLDLTWYRAYDPEKGRWLSRDPLGELQGFHFDNFDSEQDFTGLVDGLSYLDPTETSGVNLYAYVSNNSIKSVDPEGLFAAACVCVVYPPVWPLVVITVGVVGVGAICYLASEHRQNQSEKNRNKHEEGQARKKYPHGKKSKIPPNPNKRRPPQVNNNGCNGN